jgi:hypothetical protein
VCSTNEVGEGIAVKEGRTRGAHTDESVAGLDAAQRVNPFAAIVHTQNHSPTSTLKVSCICLHDEDMNVVSYATELKPRELFGRVYRDGVAAPAPCSDAPPTSTA